jgi:UDP-N-acetylmuramate: L-alanyl-gamma-D-glutamyl-meso-diaminopimelate ligase
MKLGRERPPPASLERADRVYCYAANLWDAAAVLAPLGDRVRVVGDLDQLIDAIVRDARPGDNLLVMSNGGFGGIHSKLLARLAARRDGRDR